VVIHSPRKVVSDRSWHFTIFWKVPKAMLSLYTNPVLLPEMVVDSLRCREYACSMFDNWQLFVYI